MLVLAYVVGSTCFWAWLLRMARGHEVVLEMRCVGLMRNGHSQPDIHNKKNSENDGFEGAS